MEAKHLSATEARELGVLLEVNRRLLHPRGLALEVMTAEGDEKIARLGGDTAERLRLTWAQASGLDWPEETVAAIDRELASVESSPATIRVQDYRSDPEGMAFAEIDALDLEHAEAFEKLLNTRRAERRRSQLGYVVQPLEIA